MNPQMVYLVFAIEEYRHLLECGASSLDKKHDNNNELGFNISTGEHEVKMALVTSITSHTSYTM